MRANPGAPSHPQTPLRHSTVRARRRAAPPGAPISIPVVRCVPVARLAGDSLKSMESPDAALYADVVCRNVERLEELVGEPSPEWPLRRNGYVRREGAPPPRRRTMRMSMLICAGLIVLRWSGGRIYVDTAA